MSQSYEVEMVDTDLDHDQDIAIDVPMKSRDSMGIGLAAVMAAAKWKSKLIKKKERPLIYRVAAREWHGTQLEPERTAAQHEGSQWEPFELYYPHRWNHLGAYSSVPT